MPQLAANSYVHLLQRNPPGYGQVPDEEIRKEQKRWSKRNIKKEHTVPKEIKQKPFKGVRRVVLEHPELMCRQFIDVDTDLYHVWVKQEIWKCQKLAQFGFGAQKKNTFQLAVCPLFAFYAMIHELLREPGAVMEIDNSKNNKEVRTVNCKSLLALEKFLNYGDDPAKAKNEMGCLNLRKVKKKGIEYYLVVIAVKFMHTKKLETKLRQASESCAVTVSVASLNPLATTTFPADFDQTEDNMKVTKHHIKHHIQHHTAYIYLVMHLSCIYQSVDCKTYFIIACILFFGQLERVIRVNVTGHATVSQGFSFEANQVGLHSG